MRLGPVESLGVALAVTMVAGSCAVRPPALTTPLPRSHRGIPVQVCLTGAAGPYADAQTSDRTLQPAPGNYILQCGDHTKGIIHINADHPVGSDPDDFLLCVTTTIIDGYPTAGNTRGATLFADFMLDLMQPHTLW